MTHELGSLDGTGKNGEVVDYLVTDPFLHIAPALLNSADIQAYVEVTKMVAPFYPEKLKPGSYEIPLDGEVTIWKPNGEKEVIDLEKQEKFSLPSNSIAFVLLNTKFKLPSYIALRFNLRIKEVHRGILLGTGPLVDPGFEGKLFIPLHNLTNNNYEFTRGAGIIWAEFTKLSQHKSWMPPDNAKLLPADRAYVPFPANKKNLDAPRYLDRANKGNSIQSSIPLALMAAKDDAEKAKNDADAAAKTAKDIKDKIDKYGLWASVALLVSIASLIAATWNLISTANKNVADAALTISQNRVVQEELLGKVKALEAQLVVLGAKDGRKIVPKKVSNGNSICAPTPNVGCQQNCQSDCASK